MAGDGLRQRAAGGGAAGEEAVPAAQQGSASASRFWPFIRLTPSSEFNKMVSFGAIMVVVCGLAETADSTAYGRFGDGAVLAVDPRLGWWLMELPCTAAFLYFFLRGGKQARDPIPLFCAMVFCGHYLYRGWVFPYLLRTHGGSRNFSLTPAIGGWAATIPHGYLNARWFAEHGTHLARGRGWHRTWRFRLGVLLYYSGFVMLIWHDKLVRDLRSTEGPRYRIPVGGLFEYATCAQYFVELWTWAGFALISCGPNGLYIFLVSVVNLIPRAIRTHAWYLEKFGAEYPAERKYLVPLVW